MGIVIIPVATIIVLVVFSIVGLILFLRQRERNRQQVQGPVMFPNTVFVPPQNIVMPMQPVNSQFRTPVLSTPPMFNPNQHPRNPIPMPIPQPFVPSPVIPNPSSPPNPSTSDLMDRMRQVQTMMVEIHRLENSSGERNSERIQELKQRVMELSNTDEHETNVHSNLDPQTPPAYFPRDDGPGARVGYIK